MKFLLFLILSTSLATAAEYNLPARHRIDWTQTGVVGGIQQYIDARPTGGPNTINVGNAPYNLSPDDPLTTGTIAAGGTALTVASAANWVVNDTVTIAQGWPETYTVTVTAGVSADGNVNVTLGGAVFPVAVLSGDSAAVIAGKLRAASYSPWSVTGSGTQAVFAFSGNNTDIYQDFEAPGPAGFAFTHTKVDGGPSSSHTISSIAGNVFTITPARTTAAGATDAYCYVDAAAVITSALNATVSGGVVYIPAGNYSFYSAVNFGNSADRTLRGAGMAQTLITHRHNSSAISVGGGGGADYLWNNQNLALVGDHAKGVSVLNVSSSAGFEVGKMILVDCLNSTDLALDAELPVVIDQQGARRARQTLHKITALTGTTISIAPPLAYALPAALSPEVNSPQYQAERCGIENLSIDSDPSVATFDVHFNIASDCWIKDVKLTNSYNYSLYLAHCLTNTVEGCWIGGTGGAGGSNHSGLLMDKVAFSRVENTSVTDFGLCVQMNGGTGNVIGYNFFGQAVYNGFNSNHGAHNSFNLYEGNILQSVQSDGYHGSGAQDVGFRNWITADRDITNAPSFIGYGLILNRWARQYCFIGNVFGQPGDGMSYNYSLGNPNIGNSDSVGTATPSSGDVWADWQLTGTITSRTDTQATIAMSSVGQMFVGQGDSNNGPAIHWPGGLYTYRLKTEVLAISGLDVTFGVSGFDEGSAFPAVSTAITVWTGQSGFQERDLDVGLSALLVHNRSSYAGGIIIGPGGGDGNATALPGGDTLPNSLYLSAAPAFWGAMAWPPVNPDSMTYSAEIIPAGYRYVNGAGEGGGGSSSITTGTLNVTTLNVGP